MLDCVSVCVCVSRSSTIESTSKRIVVVVVIDSEMIHPSIDRSPARENRQPSLPQPPPPRCDHPLWKPPVGGSPTGSERMRSCTRDTTTPFRFRFRFRFRAPSPFLRLFVVVFNFGGTTGSGPVRSSVERIPWLVGSHHPTTVYARSRVRERESRGGGGSRARLCWLVSRWLCCVVLWWW